MVEAKAGTRGCVVQDRIETRKYWEIIGFKTNWDAVNWYVAIVRTQKEMVERQYKQQYNLINFCLM